MNIGFIGAGNMGGALAKAAAKALDGKNITLEDFHSTRSGFWNIHVCYCENVVIRGLQIYENPVGVLTNNPPFSYHLHNLCNYRNLTREPGESRFAPELPLKAWSRGMGAIGLPGDLSSASRFVRAAFTRWNARYQKLNGKCNRLQCCKNCL